MANEEKKQEDLQKYLDAIGPNYLRYHNHKENMAHLALAAQIALACAVFSGKWLPHCYLHKTFLLFAVIILWVALYLYAGWEMWFRRVAATMNKAIMRARGKIIEQETNKNTIQKNRCGINFCRWVWWPWYSKYDWTNNGFPKVLIDELEEASKEQDERLEKLEIGSWLLSILILVGYIMKLFEVL